LGGRRGSYRENGCGAGNAECDRPCGAHGPHAGRIRAERDDFLAAGPRRRAYFAGHIFNGTPFEGAPAIDGKITINIDDGEATARVEIPGFVFESKLSGFSDTTLVQREPMATAPFYQQGLEAAAGSVSLKVNGEEIPLVIPPVGITGGPCAVVAACGLYAR
jgi:hypothetical protein